MLRSEWSFRRHTGSITARLVEEGIARRAVKKGPEFR
jgi:hypothetical protein